ncbi:hypothetical protein LENED_009228 [Lentinula edodes]|uniref:Uncharacterized protein n=1 Tax=Lentinula edodes TaxID=5353 RepID=A0A1Q3EJ83_LENED|nr:hypothetical protein LENED_009228 [Lentinula edodes]
MPSASFVPALTSSLPSLPTSPAAPVPAAKPLTKPSTSTSIVGINSQLHDKDDDSDDGDVNGMDELVPPSKVGLGIGDDAVDAGRAIGCVLWNLNLETNCF